MGLLLMIEALQDRSKVKVDAIVLTVDFKLLLFSADSIKAISYIRVYAFIVLTTIFVISF